MQNLVEFLLSVPCFCMSGWYMAEHHLPLAWVVIACTAAFVTVVATSSGPAMHASITAIFAVVAARLHDQGRA